LTVSGDQDPVSEVAIREGGIRLGQFLKLAGAVDSGADVKGLIADGMVTVNDQLESRRGRQLVRGDVVALAGQRWRVG
jgi:ribosome-associated protein